MPPNQTLFSAQAADYAIYRPTYPQALYDFLYKQIPQHALAWDCATGNGQAALALADYFDQVIATDITPEQLANATPHPKITYTQCDATACPLENESADLITVAQALHWFGGDEFYQEVQRVLKPNGVFAAWGYTFSTIEPKLDDILRFYGREFLKNYWKTPNKTMDAFYQQDLLPLDPITPPALTLTAEWTFAQLRGYLNTWSSVSKYKRDHGKDPFDEISTDLHAAWDNPDTPKTVSWDMLFIAGRKPV